MLLQGTLPHWQAYYKAMSTEQLVNELHYIVHHPQRMDDPDERSAFITGELGQRAHMPGGGPIILLDDD